MAMTRWYEMRNGQTWGAMAGSTFGAGVSGYSVIIPIDQVYGLSPQEVYDAVMELLPEAEFCGLCEKVHYGLDYCKRAPTGYLESVVETWQKFKGKDAEVDEICTELEVILKRRHKRIKSQKLPPDNVPGFVYLMQCGKHYKIGMSKDPQSRLEQLSTQPPFDIELICTIPTNDMVALEAEIHKLFKHKRKRGEWFTLDTQDVKFIKEWDNDIT